MTARRPGVTYRLESRECVNPQPQHKRGVAGYTGFHAGEGGVVGRHHDAARREADRTLLPKLLRSAAEPLNYWYGDSVNGRNKSSMVFGDERSYDYRSSMTRDFLDPCPERNIQEYVSPHDQSLKYRKAREKVPEWRVDAMEEDMKSKIAQRHRGGAYLLKRSLRFFDRDNSGGLSFQEFAAGLDLLGLQYSDHEVLALMARYDPECGNDIEYATLVDMMTAETFFELPANKPHPAMSARSKVKPVLGAQRGETKPRPSPAFKRLMEMVWHGFERRQLGVGHGLTVQGPWGIVESVAPGCGIQLTVDEIGHLLAIAAAACPGGKRKCFSVHSFYEWYKGAAAGRHDYVAHVKPKIFRA